MPHSAIERRTRKRAQTLRRQPTDAEHRLWQMLRSLKSLGMHFRRQAPVGPFIVDFAWHSAKLIVEVDGGQHAELRASDDAQRTRWLNAQGYRVLRFWNNDVLRSPAGIGEAILLAVRESGLLPVEDPTPDPSPQGGGERVGANGKVVAS